MNRQLWHELAKSRPRLGVVCPKEPSAEEQ